MAELPPYFMWFPESYRWSAGLINILSAAPFGGSEISEVYRIRRLLEGKPTEDDGAWFDACNEVAATVRDHADGFAEGGYRSPAAAMYLRAAHYF
ncbi:MAG: hypothetical protein VW644_05340, partial [Alphaproteobacteria bacterium]